MSRQSTETIDTTLARIATNLDGTWLAWTPVTDDADDHRFLFAYGLAHGAWVDRDDLMVACGVSEPSLGMPAMATAGYSVAG